MTGHRAVKGVLPRQRGERDGRRFARRQFQRELEFIDREGVRIRPFIGNRHRRRHIGRNRQLARGKGEIANGHRDRICRLTRCAAAARARPGHRERVDDPLGSGAVRGRDPVRVDRAGRIDLVDQSRKRISGVSQIRVPEHAAQPGAAVRTGGVSTTPGNSERIDRAFRTGAVGGDDRIDIDRATRVDLIDQPGNRIAGLRQ